MSLFEEINDEQSLAVIIYPNPFSGSTNISFSIPQSQKIILQIFDVQGRLIRTVADEVINEGVHTLTWDARDNGGNEVSDGIYFLKMATENKVNTTSLLIAK